MTRSRAEIEEQLIELEHEFMAWVSTPIENKDWGRLVQIKQNMAALNRILKKRSSDESAGPVTLDELSAFWKEFAASRPKSPNKLELKEAAREKFQPRRVLTKIFDEAYKNLENKAKIGGRGPDKSEFRNVVKKDQKNEKQE